MVLLHEADKGSPPLFYRHTKSQQHYNLSFIDLFILIGLSKYLHVDQIISFHFTKLGFTKQRLFELLNTALLNLEAGFIHFESNFPKL